MMLRGRVVEERKNYCVVSTERGELRCTQKGALLKKRERICAGDLVNARLINEDAGEGVINDVFKRESFLPRPPLANLSRVIFINCFKSPALDLEAVDRFLFSSAAYEIEAVIVFNKMDLLSGEEAEELSVIEDYYHGIGYKTLRTSVPRKQGVDELLDICKGGISAFTGLSGVGKSSLLSLLFPGAEFRTSEVSGARGRGTHTTTHTRLLPLDRQTFAADTPGFAFVDIPAVPEETVAAHFPELERIVGECRFNNCVHDAEPGCRAAELVDKGIIAPWRLGHYLKIYKEMVKRRRDGYC